MTSFEFAMKLLEEGDVVVSPGGGFGPAGEGFLRMALVENENRLRPGRAANRPLSGEIADFCRAVRKFVARAFSR